MPTVAIVDDEPHIVELARLNLENAGFRIVTASDGQRALEIIEESQPDLVVLDIMLPGMDGWEVCRRLRQGGSNVPVIMLTARGHEVDRIVGIELGADDYVVKPFNPRELVARVRAVLRRTAPSTPEPKPILMGRLEVDAERRDARIEGRQLRLRAKEFDLLLALAKRPGIVFSRDQLLENVWGYSYGGGTRTVDVHVARLRNKPVGSEVAIETVWSVGSELVEK